MMAGWSIMSFMGPYFLNYWIEEHEDKRDVIKFIGMSLLIMLVSSVAKVTRSLVIILHNLTISRTVNMKMVSSLCFAPLSTFFDRVPIGRILNRFLKDTDDVDLQLAMTVDRFIFIL